MKTLRMMFVFVVIMGVSTLSFSAATKRTATITKVEGKVDFKGISDTAWTRATVGTVLTEGHTIWTEPKSFVHLRLDGREGSIEIAEDSQIHITKLIQDDEKGTENTLFDVAIGEVLFKTKKMPNDESKFEVRTPVSMIGVRGTEFLVKVELVD